MPQAVNRKKIEREVPPVAFKDLPLSLLEACDGREYQKARTKGRLTRLLGLTLSRSSVRSRLPLGFGLLSRSDQ